MEIIREFAPSDRYKYDSGMCSEKNGYAQVDTKQDAPYFGTWASPEHLTIVCYCEGDLTITRCDNPTEFVEQVREMQEWNEKGGYWKGIDPGWGDKIAPWFVVMGLGDLLH